MGATCEPRLGPGHRGQLRAAECLSSSRRAVVYSFAFFSSKRLGKGQFYLMTIVDREGAPLDGAMNYRLNVPANSPVTQYWSATVYNRDTHTLITDVDRAGRSSQSPGQKTPDGSVDIYFGPMPPTDRESN
jgi:hypothetical protein